MPSVSVWSHGVDCGTPVRLTLTAGPLSIIFEPDEVFLRYFRLGRHEILRGVYAAVRDHNWDTIAPKVSNVDLRESDGGFVLNFDVECRAGEIDFVWQGRIVGESVGRVVFSLSGEARADFRRNRLGFCVLHAAESAGAACRVEKVGGALEEGVLPVLISPHQPFMDMEAIAHEVEEGVWASVRFFGDTFEMEDQRNWSDASYKTYCTPLARPFPVEVKKGERIEQSITIEVQGAREVESALAIESAAEEPVILRVGESGPQLMRLGLGLASDGQELSDVEIERLRALSLAHLRADLHLYKGDWREGWQRVCAEATSLNTALELAIFLSGDAESELAELAAVLDEGHPSVQSILLFLKNEKSTRAHWLVLAQRALGGCGALIGAGSNAYFTEINRERPPIDQAQFVSYSLNPQVHAFDDASLVETLAMQALTVESARAFCGGLPLSVSSVTLQPRFNPNATGPDPWLEPGQLPAQVDPRQMSLLGAAWTAISLKYLGSSALFSATYYETCGWRGVVERAAGSALPELFPSTPGGVFPLYHVLADVGEFAGGNVLPVQTSAALCADALALEKDGRCRLLVANLTADTQVVQVVWDGLGSAPKLRRLDESSVERAVGDPEAYRSAAGEILTGGKGRLALPPFAVWRLDGGE